MNKGPANKKIIYYFNLTELDELFDTALKELQFKYPD